MLRKIVQHGPSTMTVSLPTKWVKKNSIKKGDDINIFEEGNKLIIGAESSSKKKITEIDISGLCRSAIMFYIRSIYRQGYDEVIVRFENSKTIYYDKNKEEKVIAVIHQEVNRLVGFEVTQEKEDFCVIKDLSGVIEGNLDVIIKRIFFLMKDTIDELVESIKKKNYEKLETMEEKHDTITKFISYCLRIFIKKPEAKPEEISGMIHILRYMDTTTDIIKYFSRDVIHFKPAFSKKSILVLENLRKISSITRKILFVFDLKNIIEFMKLRAKTKKLFTEIQRDSKKREAMILCYLAPTLEISRDLIETKMSITTPKITRESKEE